MVYKCIKFIAIVEAELTAGFMLTVHCLIQYKNYVFRVGMNIKYAFSTYPVGAKWHIMALDVGSENIVSLVAKENPNIGIL